MSQYAYIKAPPGYTLAKPKSPKSKIKLVISLVLITLGITSVTTVLYPLISYQLSYAPNFRKSEYISPSSDNSIEVSTVKAQEPTFVPEMINTTLDYTNTDNWFAQSESSADLTNQPTPSIIYKLSVPKLGIKDALVRTNSTDLKQSLIQYPGTSMPGEYGNPVIFGHSVLPQFFDPDNYNTLFSTMHTLKIGDEVFIEYDGIEYRYMIKDIYEVEPTNLDPLAQTYDDRHLTLITCTPPGTYLRRLIIKLSLI